jgi:hypothetical protein
MELTLPHCLQSIVGIPLMAAKDDGGLDAMRVPRVSVLMPVHNGMPYLPAALESVLAQTFRDLNLS